MPPFIANIAKFARVLLLPLVLGIGIVFFVEYGEHINTDFIKRQSALLQQYYAEHPIITLALFTVFVTLYIAAAIPGGQIAPIAAGLFFGYAPAVIVTLIFYAIGPTLTFLLARYGIGEWLQRRYADKLVDFNRGVERDGALYLFILRQLPLPFFAVNLCLGLTSVSITKYIWANSLALLPSTITGPYFGTVLASLESSADLFTVDFFIALTAVSLVPPLVAKLIINIVRQQRSTKPE